MIEKSVRSRYRRLIEEKEVVITLPWLYKGISADTYSPQRRGSKGIQQ